MYESELNILKMAQEKKTAVIAFICMDYVMARTVVYAAEATKTPAIIMLYPEHVRDLHTSGFKAYTEMVKELANEVSVPIGLHIDHDFSYEAVEETIGKGFESIMIDASMMTLEENITITKKVVDMAHSKNIYVEGEIGHVGSAKNDDNEEEDFFTSVNAAKKFCEETKVDSLAVSIGNAHGEYSRVPKLDIGRLEEIRDAVNIPLVLHGGSGIPDDQLRLSFSKGICKLNLGTEYLKRYYDAVSDFISVNESNKDPVKIINMPYYVQKILQPYVEERLNTLCNF